MEVQTETSTHDHFLPTYLLQGLPLDIPNIDFKKVEKSGEVSDVQACINKEVIHRRLGNTLLPHPLYFFPFSLLPHLVLRNINFTTSVIPCPRFSVSARCLNRMSLKGEEDRKSGTIHTFHNLKVTLPPKSYFYPSAWRKSRTSWKIIQSRTGAIRGAGQQPLPGCANIQEEITLDLALLNGVRIHDGIVSIAAGERWGAVYTELSKEGLGVTGARSGNNGVGGLALSGTYMYMLHSKAICVKIICGHTRSLLF